MALQHHTDPQTSPNITSSTVGAEASMSFTKTSKARDNSLDFIRSLPENTFTEILAHLQPKNDLSKTLIPYSRLSAATVQQLHLPSSYHVIRRYLLDAVQILDQRKKSGRTLSVVDYSIILGFARWLGLKDIADTFWKSMQADTVVPDLRCYNNYLGALVSNLRHDSDARQNRRVTTFRTEARRKPSPSAMFAAYHVGIGGIKDSALELHREMLKSEVVPDEETFRLLILGVGREGDLDTVKRLLRQVWRIDVAAVVDGLEEGHSKHELDISTTSPLHPSPFLVYAVAHVFSINNKIPAALKLVDHISQTYNVKVFDYVWHELLNWTFVLSLPRQASKNEKPVLPRASVQKLWEVMRNEPYSVRPTMDMYNKLIKSLFRQQRTRDMWHYMCEALPLYEAMRKETRYLNKALHRVLKLSQPIGTLEQKYNRSRLNEKASRLFLKRWVRLLLGSMRSWRRVDGSLYWSTRLIPKIVLEWKEFMPSHVWYDIPAGRVSIVFRTSEEKKTYQGRIMKAMDTNDRLASKHNRLRGQDGNRYVQTRRQQRAVAQRGNIPTSEQDQAE
ncbi:hypothetical protein E4T50_06838 [Aureobasidium sp. EXF-12298]|nr:hypothetical protein E4T50_06838 [Aureobasidium sp. EXF-12298]KAI4760094.1 hypothetical protein E4T51_06897 [Aureobasidium sp. EXF-12344]KAI4777086.1 hypothetical protein E4T52_07986 [Aureobasidium sp. EXF-3400]